MFVLLGAVCIFAKVNCTPIIPWGKPYESKEKCVLAKHKMDAAIGSVEWIDGQFECVEDKQVI